MDAKLTITTMCGARCKTCPVWKLKEVYAKLSDFKKIWQIVNNSGMVDRMLLNGIGDMYMHPEHVKMFQIIERTKKKPVIMTTNAYGMDYVPKIDKIIVSFNGGTKEKYEETTGLPFEKVVQNIKKHYDELARANAEIHCLICKLNEGTEDGLLKIFGDFPGRIRVSYKCENQMQEDLTVDRYKEHVRIPCDYLAMLIVWPDGTLSSCNHDFWLENNWGNLIEYGSVERAMINPDRKKLMEAHLNREYPGLCKKCNYNIPIVGRILYIK